MLRTIVLAFAFLIGRAHAFAPLPARGGMHAQISGTGTTVLANPVNTIGEQTDFTAIVDNAKRFLQEQYEDFDPLVNPKPRENSGFGGFESELTTDLTVWLAHLGPTTTVDVNFNIDTVDHEFRGIITDPTLNENTMSSTTGLLIVFNDAFYPELGPGSTKDHDFDLTLIGNQAQISWGQSAKLVFPTNYNANGDVWSGEGELKHM